MSARRITLGMDLQPGDQARYAAIHGLKVSLGLPELTPALLDQVVAPVLSARTRARRLPGGRHHGPYRARRDRP